MNVKHSPDRTGKLWACGKFILWNKKIQHFIEATALFLIQIGSLLGNYSYPFSFLLHVSEYDDK